MAKFVLRFLALVTLALTLFMATAFGQTEAEAPQAQLVGLHLGMSPDEALDTLASAGYGPIDDPYDQGLWNDKFKPRYDEIVADTRKTGIYNNYTLPGVKKTALYQAQRSRAETDEFVKLTFNGFPSGQRLVTIQYTNMSPTLTAEQFQARVAERYGDPNAGGGWRGSPKWDYGTVAIDGIDAADSLTMDNRVGLPRRILTLQRTVNTAAYIARIRALAEEGTTPSETTF